MLRCRTKNYTHEQGTKRVLKILTEDQTILIARRSICKICCQNKVRNESSRYKRYTNNYDKKIKIHKQQRISQKN